MEKRISIATDRLKELYKNLTYYPYISKEQVEYEMCKVFGEDTFKKSNDDTRRIKTFEQACHKLGDSHYLVSQYKSIQQKDTKLDAFMKLCIITDALNEGWTPNFTEYEHRYYPFFRLFSRYEVEYMKEDRKKDLLAFGKNSMFFDMMAISTNNLTVDICPLLTLKDRDLAEYCGEQFKDIWFDYLIGQ